MYPSSLEHNRDFSKEKKCEGNKCKMHITTLAVITMYIAYWEKLDQNVPKTGVILLSRWLHVNRERNDAQHKLPRSISAETSIAFCCPLYLVLRNHNPLPWCNQLARLRVSYVIDTSLDTRFTSYFLLQGMTAGDRGCVPNCRFFFFFYLVHFNSNMGSLFFFSPFFFFLHYF